MKIKMAELVEKTGVPKSTILYYIKEGLLPEPERIKQNVCLYDAGYVERIKFIKYLQTAYSRTISEIKSSMCSHSYDFSEGSDMLIDFLEKLSGTPANSCKMTKKELSDKSGLSEDFITSLVDKCIVIPLSEELFDEKDMEIVLIYHKLFLAGWSTEFFEKYADISRELSSYAIKGIMDMKKKLNEDGTMSNEVQHLMFEIPLNIEPYIINRLGLLEHRNILNGQESKLCKTKKK
jgi:DNA-binding transcriptional MerR regulator